MEMSQHPHVVEMRNSSGDGQDEDPPRRSENKRKRFHPFRVVRNIFRKAKRQGSDEVQSSSKKSRSTSELSRVPTDVPQFPGLAPPYAVGLSVSHDSIFTPEHGNPQDDLQASSLSIQHAGLRLEGFQDELFTRVRARRDSDDDDDDGLPHSPCTSPTTADVLAQGLKDKSSKSRSTCSASSLLSMGSSENDEDSSGPRFMHLDRRSVDSDADLDAAQPVPLNHDAALHKIAVRPKRTHGLPHHRKLQQMAASAVAILPVTPEGPEDLGKFPTTSSTPPPISLEHETESIDPPETPPEKVSIEEESTQESSSLLVTTKIDNAASISVFEGLKVSEIPSVEEEHYPEKEVHVSKGKSAAAELKLRHEIKEFSKRQNEKREGMTALSQNEDELVEVVDVKESIRSLELTISVGDAQNETSTAGEEQETAKSLEEGPKDLEGDGWCVIELGQNPEPPTESSTEKLKVNDGTEDIVQRTVINVTDIQITGQSNNSNNVVTNNVQELEKLPNTAEKQLSEPLVNILYQQNQTVPIANAGPSVSSFEAVVKEEVSNRAPMQNESEIHSTETPNKRNSIPTENGHSEMAAESKSSPNVASERPHVVLRRHTSNRTVSQPSDGQKDFRASADASSSPNFSDIMKHRRSLVDSELSADGSGSVVKNYGRSQSEEVPKSTVTTNRFSVEILPFSQRLKNPSYMSPSKTSGGGEEKSPSLRDEKQDDGSLQQQEGVTGSTRDEFSPNKGTPSRPERMQYPVQFRIRKGRSFSEVKESSAKREEFGDRTSEPKPLLRPKPQLSQKEEVVGTTPEFMRIQLRSSKEELDKSDISPASQQPTTPQWEVKIQPKLQRQKSGPSSLPYIPPPHGNETRKVVEEKVMEINGNIIEKTPLEKKISDEPKISADPALVATDGNKEIPATKEDVKPKDDGSSSDRMSEASFVSESEDGIAQSPGSQRKGSNAEPELFRVFARRSIKQRNTDKTGEAKSNRKVETPETGINDVAKATESSVTMPLASKQQKPETKVSEIPKKQDVKMNELPRKPAELSRAISKEPTQKQEPIDRKSEQPVSQTVTAKKVEVEEEKSPVWRNVTKGRVNSDVNRQSHVETSLHRRNSVPAEKENMVARELTQVTVNIQRPTIPLTRNDSSPKLSNNNKDSSGNTPSWMQLAQQRREQREQKERMLYASTGSSSFVLEPNSRPSRNSKVLDMVNNFQKLQTT